MRDDKNTHHYPVGLVTTIDVDSAYRLWSAGKYPLK